VTHGEKKEEEGEISVGVREVFIKKHQLQFRGEKRGTLFQKRKLAVFV